MIRSDERGHPSHPLIGRAAPGPATVGGEPARGIERRGEARPGRGEPAFTEEQERAIVIMMEDRRRASEDLFGDLMNFQAGPTRGDDADHLRSAIEWMEGEFLKRLQDYLTPQQLAAWVAYRESAGEQKTSRRKDD